MSIKTSKNTKLHIGGMTCAACDVLVERKLKKVPGIVAVSADFRRGTARITSVGPLNIESVREALADHPQYSVHASAHDDAAPVPSGVDGIVETAAIAFLVLAAWYFLRAIGLMDRLTLAGGLVGGAGGGTLGYGTVFVIGLVAAVSSCIAVTGGLLLSVTAAWQERHPHLTGIERFTPHLLFNLGRLISYGVLGGAVGALGSVLVLSSRVNGIVVMLASALMVILALNMLKVFPGLSWLTPRIPKALGHRIHDASDVQGRLAPFLLGAATFFLPCGFTQSLQVYSLSTGSAVQGAATMFVFALGTFPALLGIGALSAFMRGTPARLFTKVAAFVVLIFAFGNFANGWALTGLAFPGVGGTAVSQDAPAADVPAANNVAAAMENGEQVVRMVARPGGYAPNRFTVKAGVPVRWVIDASQAYGCESMLVVPSLDIEKSLMLGENIITFTPAEPGTIPFSCSMGMYRGTFTVTP